MALFKSNRFAWSVALAALALWVISAPATWGQVFSDPTAQTAPCPQGFPFSVAPPAPDMTPPPAAEITSADEGAFHICGPDPQTERAIEQLIAGRGVSSSLKTLADGCAELTIRATAPVGNGMATSRMNVTLGGGSSVSILITSRGGATQVSIAEGQ